MTSERLTTVKVGKIVNHNSVITIIVDEKKEKEEKKGEAYIKSETILSA